MTRGLCLLGFAFLCLITRANESPRSRFLLAAGSERTCAVTPVGKLACWGYNGYGALGTGNNAPHTVPHYSRTQTTPAIVDLSGAMLSVCAVFDNGRAKCWGYNNYGNLGYGIGDGSIGATFNTDVESLPFLDLGTNAEGQPLKVKRIKAGYYHSCAIVEETLKCWGRNVFGQLGQGDTLQRGHTPATMGNALKPIDLGKGEVPVDLSLGDEFTCALLKSGKVKCFGHYAGTGSGGTSPVGVTPKQMGDALKPVDLGNETVIGLTSSYQLTCVLTRAGQVKCFGTNTAGRLGIGNNVESTIVGRDPKDMGANLKPVMLGGELAATKVECNGVHCCAMLENGTMKCWGYGAYGNLGTGDTKNRGTVEAEMGDGLPYVDLGKLAEVVNFTAGSGHTCAELSTGHIKCWGYNNAYQLGTGKTGNVGATGAELGDNLKVLKFPTEDE